MTGAVATPAVVLSPEGLAQFMPMHLLMAADGRVLGIGPTLGRVLAGAVAGAVDGAVDGALDGAATAGARFEDLFDVRAPFGAVTAAEVLDRAGQRFRLVPRHRPKLGLRGLGRRLGPEGQILMNLSFGIDLIAAVRDFALTDADFAATDLAMELLYLAEANAAVNRELRGLNLRLEGARLAAEEEALTDPLTGLRNRRAADLCLERLCAAKAPFGLLHMDLDFFKPVNDRLGHAAGDMVLAEVGRILREQTRGEDCAARIGGDEFLLVVTGPADPRTLQAIAERIIARVSEPVAYGGQRCQVSASIGMVRSVDMARPDPAKLMAAADRALYAAKHAGRSRAVLLPVEPG